MLKKITLCLFVLIFVGACSEQEASHIDEPVTVACEKLKGLTPYCGFKNPEDLVIIPDGSALLVSEMGEFMMDSPGSLSILNLIKGEKQSIDIDWEISGDNWGDASCEKPAEALFSPHGIDLMTRKSGEHQLLVVNHGGRESVEFFSLSNQSGPWSLNWKGCALPPGDPFINDVASLNDGGFLVTQMWNKSQSYGKVVAQLLLGMKVGWVWEWHPEEGFKKLEGSTEQMPNGIAISPDNQFVYINIYMANKTIKVDRLSGELVGEFAVQQPDNITLDEDGQLWVASHKHNPILQNCNDAGRGPCLLPFEIVRADAKTMQVETVLAHDGEPMGYSTVGLRVGDKVFMGSAHGDRVVSFDIPER